MFDFLDDLFNVPKGSDFSIDENLRPGMAYLSNLVPGTELLIGEEAYMVLEHTGTGASKVIRKELLQGARGFGSDADWKESQIREYLNGEYYERISGIIGRENIIEFSRDLTSLDGLDDYGTCVDKVSMLTASEYAKYHRIFGVRSRYHGWWWTITPFSTPSNDYHRYVCYVNSNGTLNWNDCDNCNGVRPFWWISEIYEFLRKLQGVHHIIKRAYNLSHLLWDKYK